MAKHRFVVEQAALVSAATKIDKKAGVIRGVKVLGIESRNDARVLGLAAEEFGDAIDRPYRYADDALQRACGLYDRASVYSNHLEFGYTEDGARYAAQEAHSNESFVGWLENPRVVRGDGLYADLHCLITHPFYSILLEIAQKCPDKLALSHEAGFESPEVVGGTVEIGEITRVDGVALINQTPGTTRGLFESAAPNEQMRDACLSLIQAAAEKANITRLENALHALGISSTNTTPSKPANKGKSMNVSKKGSLAAELFRPVNSPLAETNTAQVRAKSRAKKIDASRKGALAEAIQPADYEVLVLQDNHPGILPGGILFGD